MTPTEYLEASQRTLTGDFHSDRVASTSLELALSAAIGSAKVLNRYKRTLFYGTPDGHKLDEQESLADFFKEHGLEFDQSDTAYRKFTDYVHGVIGIFTEAGELLEHLVEKLRSSENAIDAKQFLEFTANEKTNLIEECGDSFFYFAALLRSIDTTFEDAMAANDRKLRVRYPEKFTLERATERNIAAEMDAVNNDMG